MRNVWTLIQREYLERVRTRSFVIFTLLMPAAMAGIVIVPTKIAEMNTGGEHRLVIVANDSKLGSGVAQELTGAKAKTSTDDPSGDQQFGRPTTYAIAVVGDTSDAERDRLNKEVMDGKITGFLWLTDDALAFLQAHGMQPTNPDFKAFQDKMKTVYDQFSPKYPELFKMLMERNA